MSKNRPTAVLRMAIETAVKATAWSKDGESKRRSLRYLGSQHVLGVIHVKEEDARYYSFPLEQ